MAPASTWLETCPACSGQGFMYRRKPGSRSRRAARALCEFCRGQQYVRRTVCGSCKGAGTVQRRVPTLAPGVYDDDDEITIGCVECKGAGYHTSPA